MMEILGRPAANGKTLRMASAALAAALLLIAAACGGGDQQVTGLVLEVVGRGLAEIESIRLRDDDGRVWEFSTDGPVGTNAAHLRQHQLAGERVSVTYREEGGRLIAVAVGDTPDSSR